MLLQAISWDEVIHAGTVIFGPTFVAAAQAGGWRVELKTAYRRRVLETHPDRAAVLGRSEAELLREFRAVSEAYELLVQHRAGPIPPVTASPSSARAAAQPRPSPPAPRRAAPPAPPSQAAPSQAAPRAASWPRPSAARPAAAPAAPAAGPAPRRAGAAPAGRAAGPVAPDAEATARPAAPRVVPPWSGVGLPRRKLRLAEFLYYSGRVSWQDFVQAVAWQRGQRPAVGRIAVDFGFLDRWEVAEILERRRVELSGREPFGEFAVRRGYLTPFQLLALLGQQLRLQQPIGQYFVGRGLVDAADLDRARAVIFRHNVRQVG